MAKEITCTIGNLTAETDVPSDSEAMFVLRYQIALESIQLEKEKFHAMHIGEAQPPITDEEYFTREAILDNLEQQFKNLLLENAPDIVWIEQ